jgi:uncharacterized membrane protein (DUF373 family)
MKTIVTHLDEYVIHVEVVFLVAMIAIARHAIGDDSNKVPPLAMIGIGAIIVAVTIGYYYVKKAGFLGPQCDRSAQAIE